MRLTTIPNTGRLDRRRPAFGLSNSGAVIALAAAILLIFWLDRVSADAPVQHLYYLPIVFAAIRFGMPAGIATSLTAIVLYHLAGDSPTSLRYQEADLLKMALFVGIGVVTARLSGDGERLRRLAMTDDLTGLHNLRSFEAELLVMVKALREARQPLSMLVLDVDRLKALNDQYGHLAGAEAVRFVGHIIAGNLPPEAVACRYGGDEFAIALPNFTCAQAEQQAERLRAVVHHAAPVLLDRAWPSTTLSISIGVACRWFDGRRGTDDPGRPIEQEGEDLFHAADQALYQAKANGRNCVSVLNAATPVG